MQFGKKTILRYLPTLGYYHSYGCFIHNDDKTLRLRVRTTKVSRKNRRAFIDVGYNCSFLERLYFKPEDFITPEQLHEIILKQFDKVKAHYTGTKNK